jgi:hypothetical protein
MNDALVFSALARQGRTPPIEDRHIVEKVSKESAIRNLEEDEEKLTVNERDAKKKKKRNKKQNVKQGDAERVLMDDSEPEKLFDKTGHLPTDPDPEHRIKHVDDYV